MLKRFLAAFVVIWIASVSVAADLGDDGLHKTNWMQDTFLDLREDLEDANSDNKRLLVLIEQRGCIYCTKMHEDVYPIPEIATYIEDNYYVVQLNMFGDREVTDFDGTTLPEKDMVRRWSMLFTPTMMFFPQSVDQGVAANEAAVVVMPGAFGKYTTYNLLNWVVERGYDGDEPFQKYHARRFEQGMEFGG